ncbi:hypothetical protein BGX26_006373 [Mortierella sp. AD094]|nr:hypothetical protein BGX26_006373 [Mortierella sp. AD094]
MSSSLKLQPLNSGNRPGVAQLLFDTHMRSVPATFNLLKLRPVALLLWTAIATAILKFRKTALQEYHEVITILAGSVLLAHGVLFLSLLYDASTQAPGPDVAGKLELFVDQDQKVQPTSETTSSDVNSRGAKKRSTESSASSSPSSSSSVTQVSPSKDNIFLVLEKTGEPIGCIGAVIDRSRGEARLVSWAIKDKHRRHGSGSLLLKVMMDELRESGAKVQNVRVFLQGSQVPALRLFHKFGFKQIDRTPEWLGERVILEISLKDWVKNNAK